MPACGSSAALQEVPRPMRISTREPNGEETSGERRLKRSADGLLPCHGAVGWAVRLQIGNVGRNLQLKVRRVVGDLADMIHLVEAHGFEAPCLDEVQSVRPRVSAS